MGYLGGEINPYWPFTVSRLVFYPDFTNRTNKAELYARSVSGIEVGQETTSPAGLSEIPPAGGRPDGARD